MPFLGPNLLIKESFGLYMVPKVSFSLHGYHDFKGTNQLRQRVLTPTLLADLAFNL